MLTNLVYVLNLAEEITMFKVCSEKVSENHPYKGKHVQSKRKGPLHKKWSFQLRIYSVNVT